MVRFITDSSEQTKKSNKRSKRSKPILPTGTHPEGEASFSPGKDGKKQKHRKPTSKAKDTQFEKQPKSAKPASKQKQQKPVKQKKQKKQKQPAPHKQKHAETKEPARKKRPDAKPVIPWKLTDYAVPEKEDMTRFHDLKLPESIMHAIADLTFQYCTPIQAKTLPTALKGQDVTGRAQTGTGKTAAFLITIFTRLLNNPLTSDLRKATPRALIIAPTRELVSQITKEATQIAAHTSLNIVAIYGGKEYAAQKKKLAAGPVDLVIATPGRLLDMKRRHDIHLGHVEIMVLDEADRMLDMGFIPSVRQIINSTPPRAKRQTMLFSATLTPAITRLASQWMKEAITIEIEPEQVAAENVDQRVYIVTNKEKFALLYNLLQRENPDRVLIFVNRRDTADRLTRRLNQYDITCSVLSGALPQRQRERTLEDFRSNKIKVMVATDVAGRGLHIDSISHVFNYNLPVEAEDYVHRIGRTGRAGSTGVSISFACDDDAFYIPDIEKYLGHELVCSHPEPEWLELEEKPELPDPKKEQAKHKHHRPHRSSQSNRPRRPRR